MQTAPAWIFGITKSISAAVGEFELVHLPPEFPVLYEVPKTPHFCQRVMLWQQRIVPVMDLARRFQIPAEENTKEAPSPATERRVGIFAYRAKETGTHEFGALFIASLPQRREISDAQLCSLPAGLDAWAPYVISCFQYGGERKAVPILNLAQLFSA